MTQTVYFPALALHRQVQCGGVLLNCGRGCAQLRLPEDEKQAARAVALAKGVLAASIARCKGETAARLALEVKPQPPQTQPEVSVLLEDVLLPASAQSGPSAVWFAQALAQPSPRRVFAALYNAFGALPGGYGELRRRLTPELDEQALACFFAAVEQLHREEGDLAEEDEPLPPPDFPDADRLKEIFLRQWGSAYLK